MTQVVAQAARRGAQPRRVAARLCGTGALAGALLVAGCTGDSQERKAHPDERGEGAGPLSAVSGIGGNGLRPGEGNPWTANFGSFQLCTGEPAHPVVLEGVRYHAVVEPVDVSVWLRKVEASDVVMEGPEPADEYTSFYTAVGDWPTMDNGTWYAGEQVTDLVGYEITRSCDDVMRLQDVGFDEIIFTFTVDEKGGYLSGATVDYTVNGKPYALEIDWEMWACGTAVTEVDGLDGDPCLDG